MLIFSDLGSAARACLTSHAAGTRKLCRRLGGFTIVTRRQSFIECGSWHIRSRPGYDRHLLLCGWAWWRDQFSFTQMSNAYCYKAKNWGNSRDHSIPIMAHPSDGLHGYGARSSVFSRMLQYHGKVRLRYCHNVSSVLCLSVCKANLLFQNKCSENRAVFTYKYSIHVLSPLLAR